MLTLTPHVKIDVHLPPTDLRQSFAGPIGLARSAFQAEPRNGSWFLFFNHRRDRVKILAWEPDGFSIWYKRLEAGTFENLRSVAEGQTREIDSTELVSGHLKTGHSGAPQNQRGDGCGSRRAFDLSAQAPTRTTLDRPRPASSPASDPVGALVPFELTDPVGASPAGALVLFDPSRPRWRGAAPRLTPWPLATWSSFSDQ
jgi:transposase